MSKAVDLAAGIVHYLCVDSSQLANLTDSALAASVAHFISEMAPRAQLNKIFGEMLTNELNRRMAELAQGGAFDKLDRLVSDLFNWTIGPQD